MIVRTFSWDFYHRNLLEVAEWRDLLEGTGFTVVTIKHFQPDWFTFWFRMLRLAGTRGFGSYIPSVRDLIWSRCHSRLVHMVRRSVEETECGGNIFFIAQKVKADGSTAIGE